MTHITYHVDNNAGWYEVSQKDFYKYVPNAMNFNTIADLEKKTIYLEHNSDGLLYMHFLRMNGVTYEKTTKYYDTIEENPARYLLTQKGY